jgi:hypothetical protein
MSSYQDKLKKYEVTPPADVWAKISSELDESLSAQEFPSALYGMEAIPPAAAWNNIAAELDESAPGQKLASKLYNMEVAPPASAWSRIDTALYPAETETAPVVAISRRRNSFLRYAVAAAVIGIAAFGIIKWMGGATDPDDSLANNPKRPDTTVKTPARIPVQPTPKEELAPANQPVGSTEMAVTETTPRPRRDKSNAAISNAAYSYADADYASNPLYAYEDHSPRIADRYIMLMTPEGNFIRMSKKWSDMVCCVSGEEQDADCKNQLKQWQQKLATSSVASPGNFLDILSLVNSLENATTEL